MTFGNLDSLLRERFPRPGNLTGEGVGVSGGLAGEISGSGADLALSLALDSRCRTAGKHCFRGFVQSGSSRLGTAVGEAFLGSKKKKKTS